MKWSILSFVGIVLLTGVSRTNALEPLMTNFSAGMLLHPIADAGDQSSRCDSADNIHIFCVNGVDPLCFGNFNGLCQHLKKRGFTNTHFGQLWSYNGYAHKIREVRQRDPGARIVLIGYSMGSNYVRALANVLCSEGIEVDLLVYLGGDTISDCSRSFPGNVRRVLNITAHGCALTGGNLFVNGADITNARNCRLPTRHFLAPSRPETQDLLIEELTALICPEPRTTPSSLQPSP